MISVARSIKPMCFLHGFGCPIYETNVVFCEKLSVRVCIADTFLFRLLMKLPWDLMVIVAIPNGFLFILLWFNHMPGVMCWTFCRYDNTLKEERRLFNSSWKWWKLQKTNPAIWWCTSRSRCYFFLHVHKNGTDGMGFLCNLLFVASSFFPAATKERNILFSLTQRLGKVCQADIWLILGILKLP